MQPEMPDGDDDGPADGQHREAGKPQADQQGGHHADLDLVSAFKKAGATSVVKTATGTAFSPASMRGGMDFIRVIRT